MDINKIQGIMIKYGIVIRAISYLENHIVESRHYERFKNLGAIDIKLEYLKGFNREMCTYKSKNSLGGKFLIKLSESQNSTIAFNTDKIFDSLEDVYKYILSLESKEILQESSYYPEGYNYFGTYLTKK